MKDVFLLIFLIFSSFCLSSCAAEGSSASSQDLPGNKGYISFEMSVRGKMSPQVFYCILLNADGDKIQPDDVVTFTDVIRIQFINELQPPLCIWFHKTNPKDDQLTPVGYLDSYFSVAADGSTAIITFPINDTGVLFNNYISSVFTAQALVATIDDSDIGRFIDALGPDLASATLYSVTVDKKSGPVSALNPASYPTDSIGDCEASNIPAGVDYNNVDLTALQIIVK